MPAFAGPAGAPRLAFNLTNTQVGDSSATGITYHSFSTADAPTVTGALNFDDGNQISRGMTFASVTDVSGTGAITNVLGNFFVIVLAGLGGGQRHAPILAGGPLALGEHSLE